MTPRGAGVGYVGGNREHGLPVRTQPCDRRLESVLVPGEGGYPRAMLKERLSDRVPDAPARPGDQGDPSLQVN